MVKLFWTIAALLGATSVGAGAFASHALKNSLSERAISLFETAARYQMYHALALLFVALVLSRVEGSVLLVVAGWSLIAGVLLFSGSLYALSLTSVKVLGAITPLGGVAFLVGWLSLAIAAWNVKL
ncbi:MAG TPA: DUF423 domain-containing protein [Leptolyngbyaceae cyanobacterium M33_DOE_097]|uniref:DUF423 domain-containing protein n=1 Tax=Oscillatoriales cyanobacterium SpSt-418 TaxID=2282169 RepID=A0A7C3PH43_9CYAN|nr:DUF423 domain-containing protein [Leptolyngbyaceae cyanobacterium M33_DOE_097]